MKSKNSEVLDKDDADAIRLVRFFYALPVVVSIVVGSIAIVSLWVMMG